jgi:hypothetical protein
MAQVVNVAVGGQFIMNRYKLPDFQEIFFGAAG